MEFVVYNSNSGSVILTQSTDEPVSASILNITIPEGKELVGIDIATNEPIFVDKAPTMQDNIDQNTADIEYLAMMLDIEL